MSAIYNRPQAARGRVRFEVLSRTSLAEIRDTMKFAVPAATGALPVISSVVQEYKSGDAHQTDVVCSGTIGKQGARYAVLMNDTKAGEIGLHAFNIESIYLQVDSGVSPTMGNDAYIVDASRLVSDTDNSAANPKIGVFLETGTTTIDGVSGTYALVKLMQA